MVKSANGFDDKLAQETLELFYSKYQRKFTGLFLVTFVENGVVCVAYDNSNSEKSKIYPRNFFRQFGPD